MYARKLIVQDRVVRYTIFDRLYLYDSGFYYDYENGVLTF